MKIRHEHIRETLLAWANSAGGRKVPAEAIMKAYFKQGLKAPHLFGEDHPDALGRNTQKIFRWISRDTDEAKANIQALLPAIEAALPPLMLARMRSYYSETISELLSRKQQIDRDVEALFGVMFSIAHGASNSSPGGCSLIH